MKKDDSGVSRPARATYQATKAVMMLDVLYQTQAFASPISAAYPNAPPATPTFATPVKACAASKMKVTDYVVRQKDITGS